MTAEKTPVIITDLFWSDNGLNQVLKGTGRPHDMKYVKFLSFWLKLISGWPVTEVGKKESMFRSLYRYYSLGLMTGFLVPGLLYIKQHIGILTFMQQGQTYITVFMNIVAVTHLFIHKLSHYYTMYQIAYMLLGITTFNVIPLYINLAEGTFSSSENVTFEHAVYYYLPFDYEHNLKGYSVIAVFNVYVSAVCSSYFIPVDLMLSLIMFHLWGHLKILIYNIENFSNPVSKSYLKQGSVFYGHYMETELKMVRQELKDIVIHHTFILKSIEEISENFGLIIAVYYAFHQVSGCVLLLECSQMTVAAIIRFGPLALGQIQQLIQMSVIFELLRSMTDRLIRAVYNLPWECMDSKNRKTVQIIMMRSQIALGLKAMGMVEVGCQTMATILKTTVSYFIMLQTFATNE